MILNKRRKNIIQLFSRDSDLTTSVVSPWVSQWSKHQNINKSFIQDHSIIHSSTEIDYQLRSTFNWDRLSTEIDYQLRSTIDWDQLLTEINYWLISTIDWHWLLIEINYQLRLTIDWDQLSTEINNQLRSTINMDTFQL